MQSPNTLSSLLASSAERLFVGREAERERFENWMTAEADRAAILSVFAPGGFGKTTLLRAFARSARAAGRRVMGVDGRDAAPSAGVLLQRLGVARVSDVGEALGDGGLLMFDTFEVMEGLTPFLQQELLPTLPRSTCVVIAGRGPLGRPWDEWRELIASMPLGGLKPTAAADYLRRRGVGDGEVARSILKATSGHPLALALAADLALQFGIREFTAAGEWQLAVRELAGELLRDVTDASLQLLLEAAAIVFSFDETLLEAIAGETDLGDAFARLCALTIVRPTSRGLSLHDEIRPILSADLRWRRPDRHRELRGRAFKQLTLMMAGADPAERARLHVERIALVDDDELQRYMFVESEPGRAWVDITQPSRVEILRVAKTFADALPESTSAPPPEELAPDVLEALLDYPQAGFQVARDPDGEALGYGFCVPISHESLRLLPENGAIATLAAAWCAATGASLPPGADPNAPLYLSTIAVGSESPGDAQAILARGIFPVVAASRRLLAATGDPVYKNLLAAVGFGAVPGFAYRRPDGRIVLGYQLDLTVIRGEEWAQAIVDGRPIPDVPTGAALEAAVEAALGSWHDPEALASSPLVALARFRAGDTEPDLPAADLVRGLLAGALAAAKQTPEPERRQELRALELATVARSTVATGAAERMHVSRATFYRLRKRGVRLVTEAICAGPPSQQGEQPEH